VSFLFNPSLISSDLQRTLPKGFVIRPLQVGDCDKGFTKCLGQLTAIGKTSKEEFEKRFELLKERKDYYIVVIEDTKTNQIVATGSVDVLHKLSRSNGEMGQIEDVVVDSTYRDKKFGKFIMEQLKHIGKQVGCYKILLNCNEKNIPFYRKLNFEVKDFNMAWYIPENETRSSKL